MNNPFSRGAVLRSVALVTASTYANYAIGLILSTVIARSLGPTEFGRYSYLVWLSGLLVAFAVNGLPTTGIRFVSEYLGRDQRSGAAAVHGWLARLQIWSLAAVVLLFLPLMPWLEPAGWEQQLWLVAAIALTSAAAKSDYLFNSSIAKGYGEFGVEPKTVTAMNLLSLLGVVALALSGQSLLWYLLLFVGVSIGHSILARIMVARAGIHSTHVAIEPIAQQRIRAHLAWTIGLTLVAALSNKSIETFLLNRWIGAEAVGFFLIAAALTRSGIDLLSSGLNFVLMPMMGHAFGAGGMERVAPIVANSVRYFLSMGLLLAGVGMLWASPVVTLMYGAEYTQAIILLQGMTLVGGLTLFDGGLGAALTTTDNQKQRALAMAAYVVVTAIAAFILIPLHGLLGALAAHMISRIVVCLIVLLLVTRSLKLQLPGGQILRLFLAAGVGTLAAAAVLMVDRGNVGQFIAGIAFAAVYAPATVLMRAWNEQDLVVARTIAARVPLLRRLVR